MMVSILRLFAFASLLGFSTFAHAGDWPMWRHDPGRTATTSSFLSEDLELLWSRALPPAAPAYADTRLQFDAGYEPIVLGKRVIVGSNSDDSVTAFDTDTGEQLWKFFTNGPIRFAPVGGKGRIIFGSDDGCVYCVKASDGSLVWKKRAVPSERLVLGNGRLISVWPVRGGPLLHEDRVYFAAGVWPLEGTFVFCVDAATGKTIWRNDEAAYLYQVHPHNAESYGGLAPQGYLLIESGDLVVPSSQAYPARFDLKTGELKEFELPAPGRKPGGWFASTPSAKEEQKLKRRGLLFDNEVNAKPHEDKMRTEGLPQIRSTIRTGNRDWNFATSLPGIDAKIHSLVSGDGKLFVVTESHQLYCLGEKPEEQQVRVHFQETAKAAAPAEGKRLMDLPKQGHVVLLGIEHDDQIPHLLSSTELLIIGIDARPDTIESLRQQGTMGNRVHFIEADPASIILPPYLADVIMIDVSLSLSVEQLQRHYNALRPYGGQIIGHANKLTALANEAQLSRALADSSDGWGIIIREGALEGASNYTGDWAPSEDQRVKAPLGLLWFGDSITHFKRSPQPKFIDGVMISNSKDWTDASTREGKVDYRLLDTTFTDVYTGRVLSKEEVPELRQSFAEVDQKIIQPSQYRPPRQKDDWKPDAPLAGERVNPLTGEIEPRTFPKSYGCDGGVDYGLMYSMRSGTPAFYDKRTESGTINISGPRSGCTNSVIPANGVLNLPYFYEGCTCSYPLPIALSLISMPETFEQWASWGTVEPDSLDGKLQRIGLNFGAPGDRVTDDGTLWLDIPNVGGPSPEISVTTEPPLEELESFYRHSLFLEKGSRGWPWVAGSGVRGISSVTISDLKPGSYRVRATFCDPESPLTRQGTGILTASISAGNSGGGVGPIKKLPVAETLEFDPIAVSADGQLNIEISGIDTETYLNGIEIVRADLQSSPSLNGNAHMKFPAFLTLAGALFFWLHAPCPTLHAQDAPRPNIILIMSDDMGWSDIGCYGGEIFTPTLDDLAENGLRFTQFYNTGRCCPTRASLLTGLYPHQAGIGHMTGDDKLPGYQGDLNQQCQTIAEVLKPAGYGTYISGKWHVTKHTAPDGDKHNWPLQRGFDRFYGTIHGAGSFYDPNTLTRDNTIISPYADSEYQPEQFYYTDAIADHAVRFIGEHEEKSSDAPFFVYVSFTAAHWPMHALPEDIAKFKGWYDKGYAPIQQARLKKLKELGLIDPAWDPAPLVGDWENEADKAWQSRCMEVYAAMVYSMDRGIGRIVETLKKSGELDNTLILFLQDNGGCAEGYGRKREGDGPRADKPTLPPLAADYLQPDMRPKQTRDGYPLREGRGVMPGAPDTDIGYGEEWANVSNTPYRLYKHYIHEGGISTPLIAHWPAGIPEARRNQLESQPAHLIDIMATAADLGGANYPKTIGDEKIHPMQGVSLAPAFAGKDVERSTPIYWEHEGNRAIREGDMKLVAKGANGPWELYDLKVDRTEMHDLSAEKPDLAKRLADDWEAWALRALVKPWKWDPKNKKKGNGFATIAKNKKKFVLNQGDELVKGSPDIGGKAFTVTTNVEKAGKGVVLAQGGVTHGWALYFDQKTGAPAVAIRRQGKLETIVGAGEAIPEGPFDLTMTLSETGELNVKIGDTTAIDKKTAGGPLTNTPQDPLCAGFDSNDAAGSYPRNFRFSGKLGEVTLKLLP